MSQNTKRKAWILGATGNNGGHLMAHQIGVILQKFFNCEVIAVNENSIEKDDSSIFNTTKQFKSVVIRDLIRNIQPNDILIGQPSFSSYMLGAQLICKKIMFVQGFSTYSLIDGFFDHYVAVSPFVQQFLKSTYNIDSTVISPFLNLSQMPDRIDGENKKKEVLVYPKFRKDNFKLFFQILEKQLIENNIPYKLMEERKMNQSDFLTEVNEYQYLLSLSVAEGFGLIPLEAMYLGTIPFGFDGFGGRTYMKHQENSMMVSYPDLDKIVPSILEVMQNKELEMKLYNNAISTAEEYTYNQYEKKWTSFFNQILNN